MKCIYSLLRDYYLHSAHASMNHVSCAVYANKLATQQRLNPCLFFIINLYFDVDISYVKQQVLYLDDPYEFNVFIFSSLLWLAGPHFLYI